MSVGAAAGGVGRFTFPQLCASALAADDYLHLADHFHTFIVADVPRFTLGSHNEARRFTNLVDCLYEKHARLVLSADVTLDKLLADMEGLTSFQQAPQGRGQRTGPPPSFNEIRKSPFSVEPISAVSALGSESSGRAGSGDDDTATGAQVAGVMAGAVASLQESGFAARRAVSRLLHMQSEEYFRVHKQQRLSS